MTQARPPYPRKAAPIDWVRYADGQWWCLIEGRDFDQAPHNAANAFRTWCSRHRLRAVTLVVDECVYVRAKRKDEQEKTSQHRLR